MRKKCSHCNLDGHNSRTCQNQGVRIFGKKLTPSDCFPSSTVTRKKAVQWTEEEHKMFLLGLKKLGKGDWCGIARNYVFTRTPTQVASHAQKYFIRHSSQSMRNRRSSVFDVVPHEEAQEAAGSSSTTELPQVSEKQPAMQNNSSLDTENVISDPPTNPNCTYYPAFLPSKLYSYPVVYPGFLQPGFAYPMPYCWPACPAEAPVLQSHHEIVKPVAVRLKSSIEVEEIDDLPRLSL